MIITVNILYMTFIIMFQSITVRGKNVTLRETASGPVERPENAGFRPKSRH